VISIEQYPQRAQITTEERPAIDPVALGTLAGRLSRCHDLDSLVSTALDGLEELFGYCHSLLMLRDEQGSKLYTIASHGYEDSGVGSEVPLGEGIFGMAAARCSPMRVGNLGQMRRYSKTVRRSYEEHGAIEPGREIPLPTFPQAESQLAAPAVVRGQLVGVVAIESPNRAAFDDQDEALLTVIAGLIASAIEVDWAYERAAETAIATAPKAKVPETVDGPETRVRHFPVDGSTFLGSEYLIKGVAGQILWSLLGHYTTEGRVDFTNREIRLDPMLDLPDCRDNLENRLLLLKRRLDERDAPIRIEKTGRGRFRLVVTNALRLEMVG
jgi:adenylate cyclase